MDQSSVTFPVYSLPQKCNRDVCRSTMTSYGNIFALVINAFSPKIQTTPTITKIKTTTTTSTTKAMITLFLSNRLKID